jgi:hypothetical protein
MSWDVIMFRIRGGLRSIEQIEESDFLPLGDAKEVRTAVSRVLPEVDWSGRPYGRYYGDGFSIEVGVDDKDVIDSMMLHVFGGGGAVTMIARLASANGWAAFDCSAGEFIDPANPSDASWVHFQQVRDFVREQIDREQTGGSEPPVG